MTSEDKQLLLKDICARLPYGVKINHTIYGWTGTAINFNIKLEYFAMEKDNGLCYDVPIEEVRPYLRSMSSMTEEEEEEFNKVLKSCNDKVFACPDKERRYNFFDAEQEDFMNAHHFDYRGLIEKGFALVAPDGMYKF